MDEKQKREIATFRFGIISEFVTGVKLSYGEKESLIAQKVGRSYDIPYSKKRSISRSAIHEWINSYKKAGYRIEGIYPKERKDKGGFRKLDATLRMAIREFKKERPSY